MGRSSNQWGFVLDFPCEKGHGHHLSTVYVWGLLRKNQPVLVASLFQVC